MKRAEEKASDRGKRVLLCTSEAGLRSLLVHLFRRNQCDVVCLGGNMQVLRHLLAVKALPKIMPPPDVVIVDDDWGLKRLHFLQRAHGDTPVVVLSDSQDPVWRKHLDDLDVTIERIRPVRWATLLHHIHIAEHRHNNRESHSSQRFWRWAVNH